MFSKVWLVQCFRYASAAKWPTLNFTLRMKHHYLYYCPRLRTQGTEPVSLNLKVTSKKVFSPFY